MQYDRQKQIGYEHSEFPYCCALRSKTGGGMKRGAKRVVQCSRFAPAEFLSKVLKAKFYQSTQVIYFKKSYK